MTSKMKLKSSTVLRWCTALSVLFTVLSVIVSIALEPLLPPLLQEWLTAEMNAGISATEIVVLVGVLPLFLLMLIGAGGLLFLQRWGAYLFAGANAAVWMITPFTGPVVVHAAASVVLELSIFFAGMALAVSFFTDALEVRGK